VDSDLDMSGWVHRAQPAIRLSFYHIVPRSRRGDLGPR
jgi:hypothetical protein